MNRELPSNRRLDQNWASLIVSERRTKDNHIAHTLLMAETYEVRELESFRVCVGKADRHRHTSVTVSKRQDVYLWSAKKWWRLVKRKQSYWSINWIICKQNLRSKNVMSWFATCWSFHPLLISWYWNGADFVGFSLCILELSLAKIPKIMKGHKLQNIVVTHIVQDEQERIFFPVISSKTAEQWRWYWCTPVTLAK